MCNIRGGFQPIYIKTKVHFLFAFFRRNFTRRPLPFHRRRPSSFVPFDICVCTLHNLYTDLDITYR